MYDDFEEENKNIKKNIDENAEKEEELESFEEEPELSEEEMLKQEIDEETKKMEEHDKKKKEFTFKADWTSILVKFGIFVLVIFALIFVYRQISTLFNRDTFSNNIVKIKDAAFNYYKFPNNRNIANDETLTMTLDEMKDLGIINNLKVNGDSCSGRYSFVDLTKKDNNENYDLHVYLSCGGKSEEKNFDISYNEEKHEEESKQLLYEQTRTVKDKAHYECPEGYTNLGPYCYGDKIVETINASPVYRVVPSSDTRANYKAQGYSYQYADPIVSKDESKLSCSTGYNLINGKCVKEYDASKNTSKEYSCDENSVLTGTYCMYETSVDITNSQAYCATGALALDGKCHLKKNYNISCVTGYKDSSMNSCYTKYNATKILSDWLFSTKTYNKGKNTALVMYEETSDSNGRTIYNKYIKKYIYECDNDDELVGTICRHYDEDYIKKSCSDGYHLSSDGKECYKVTNPKYKTVKTTYTCPSGYTRSGYGDNIKCVKYVKANIKEINKYSCSNGYTLTSNNKCVKEMEPTITDNDIYTCPEGYTKTSSGSSTRCYKKTTTDAYYYCSNQEATLVGDRCVIEAKTYFVKYNCPSGYSINGSICVRNKGRETMDATYVNGGERTETIWSSTQNLVGWTYTGNTKYAD